MRVEIWNLANAICLHLDHARRWFWTEFQSTFLWIPALVIREAARVSDCALVKFGTHVKLLRTCRVRIALRVGKVPARSMCTFRVITPLYKRRHRLALIHHVLRVEINSTSNRRRVFLMLQNKETTRADRARHADSPWTGKKRDSGVIRPSVWADALAGRHVNGKAEKPCAIYKYVCKRTIQRNRERTMTPFVTFFGILQRSLTQGQREVVTCGGHVDENERNNKQRCFSRVGIIFVRCLLVPECAFGNRCSRPTRKNKTQEWSATRKE